MSSVQSMRAWPRRIDPGDEIPHPFQRAFAGLRLHGPRPPELLFSPRYKLDGAETPSTLLVWDGGEATCLEALHGGVAAVTITLADVHLAEWGNALLASWLALDAHGPGGRAGFRAGFHTVGRELYRPLLDAVRAPRYAAGQAREGDPEARLRGLEAEDYRMYRFALDALPPGADLRGVLLQRRRVERRLGLLPRIQLPATLLLATQSELIVIREGAGRSQGASAAAWTFIPLDRVAAFALEPDARRRILQLRALLPGGQEAGAALDLASAPGAAAFVAAIGRGPPAAPPPEARPA
ncbi:MAG: hypothetical protein QM767_18345 [Anaeromyxobacter sp.]